LDVIKTTLKREESCSHLETWLIQRGKFCGIIRGMMPRQYLWRIGVFLSIRQKLPFWQRNWRLFARHEYFSASSSTSYEGMEYF
jgi:hypothetical protein